MPWYGRPHKKSPPPPRNLFKFSFFTSRPKFIARAPLPKKADLPRWFGFAWRHGTSRYEKRYCHWFFGTGHWFFGTDFKTLYLLCFLSYEKVLLEKTLAWSSWGGTRWKKFKMSIFTEMVICNMSKTLTRYHHRPVQYFPAPPPQRTTTHPWQQHIKIFFFICKRKLQKCPKWLVYLDIYSIMQHLS